MCRRLRNRCALWAMILGLSLALAPPPARASDPKQELPRVTVALVYDGPPPDETVLSLQRFLEIPEGIRRMTRALTRREFDVRFPESKRILGDWDLQKIDAAIDQLLADPEVDLVLTLGVLSSNLVCGRTTLPKPVIAPFAVDASVQALPLRDGTSGVPNLNYLIRRGNVLQDLVKFRELIPFDRFHVVADSMLTSSIPGLQEYMKQTDSLVGARSILVPGGDSAEEVLSQLEDAQAVYLTPLVRMPLGEFRILTAGLIERRLPSFSLQGQVDVEAGALAGLRRATDTDRVSRRVALNIQRILHGEDASELPVVLEQPERLMINMSTAAAIGYSPRWKVALEAELLNAEGPWGHRLSSQEPLSLSQSVHEAVEANLSLQAFDRSVSAGAQNVRLARSAGLPQIDVSATDVRIDADRAEASLGSQAERTLSAGVSLSQVLYSDSIRANVATAGLAQKSLESDRETAKLDTALAAATAFLNVLRAQTLERVEQNNIRLTESNLELARRRESVGFSGPADVYRWESERATDRGNVIRSHSEMHAAMLQLNRVLHRPLEWLCPLEPPQLSDPQLVTGFGRLGSFLDTVAGFDLFREFSVREGLAKSTELRSVEALLALRRRELKTARRSFWAPVVALGAEMERTVSRDGVTPVAVGAGTFPAANRDDWSLALNLSLPLYSGRSRDAATQQSSEELLRLQLERNALAESVEFRIRTALFGVGSSFPSIELAREAADAARRNLELVTDAYSRGAVSIIDLLDAQNAALAAEGSAANAVYNFLIDLMELQRSTNDFDFFRSDAGRERWFARLREFFEQAGHRSSWSAGEP